MIGQNGDLMSVRTVGLAIALVLLAPAVGCSSIGTEPPTPPPVVVPNELVGAWNSITERGNAFSYEIAADGRYIYVGIMRDGSQQYTLQEAGRVAVSTNEIVFTPQQVTLTRTDPEDTAEPTRQTFPSRSPRAMNWSISGRTLTLVESGQPTEYQRE